MKIKFTNLEPKLLALLYAKILQGEGLSKEEIYKEIERKFMRINKE